MRKLRKIKPATVLLMMYDIFAVLIASGLSLLIRFELRWTAVESVFWDSIVTYCVINIVTTVVVFYFFRLYSSLWRYAGEREIMSVILAVAVTDVIQYAGVHLLQLPLPRSYYIIYLFIMIVATVISRFCYRLRDMAGEFWHNRKLPKSYENILIYGAGKAGQMLLKEIKQSSFVEGKRVVCILDDDPAKQGSYLMGVPIPGGREILEQTVREYGINQILIAIPSMEESERKSLVEQCTLTNCRVKILPGIYQLINDDSAMLNLQGALRNVELEDLLGREPVRTDIQAVTRYLKGKTVMVTGGGGSIGSELCRQLCRVAPARIVIFDIYENDAYMLRNELLSEYDDIDIVIEIGSVCDEARVAEVFAKYRPGAVFHAAAHKHVPLMEACPREALHNNVFGTLNVVKAADAFGAARFIFISTDKAVNPTSVMGATKRMGEMVMQLYARTSKTVFSAVRFGNVLGSNGSVIPVFQRQIAAGGPVTVTHPEIERFFMTIPEASRLVIQAGGMAHGGEIFILDMGEPVKIVELAKGLIQLQGLVPDVDVKITFTGLRDGEKMYEELLMDEESTLPTDNKSIMISTGQEISYDEVAAKLGELEAAIGKSDEEAVHILESAVPTYHHTKNCA